MKAITYTEYGSPDVLKISEVAKPTPKSNEILIRIHTTTVTIGDTIMRSLNLPVSGWQKVMARLYLGWSKPKRSILGMELAGKVEAVGKNVTKFKPGDDVFGSTFDADFGGYAEYKCLPENAVMAAIPAILSFQEAAAVPGGGLTALACLKKGKIQPGQKVLIYGASGAVGTNATQLASRHFGAEVTGVCSAANQELIKSLGASQVLDYARQDFTQSGETYDLVFDAVAKLVPAQAKKALKPGGMYINVHTDSEGGHTRANLLTLKSVIEAGQLKPTIDRVYPFQQVIDAHRYVEQGHKKGNVILQIM